MTPILWALLLGAVSLAHCQQLDPGKLQAIERLIAETISRDSIPGLTVAIAAEGEMKWTPAYGFLDLENFIPAKPETAYRLASVSKPISAVAALRLAADGRLDLDAPIQIYLPDFPKKERPVTAPLLLGHLAGIRHYRDYVEIHSARSYRSLTDALSIFAHDPLVAPPGTRFSYTTYGYTLFGAAIEAVTGTSFGEYLQRSVFNQAAMSHTFVDRVSAIIPNRARGYGKDKSGKWINTNLIDTSNKVPGGGLVGTAPDLVRFALAVRNGRLLGERELNMMWSPQRMEDGTQTDYGLGWFFLHREPLIAGHSGGQPGASAMLAVAPKRGDVVAILCNMERVQLEGLALQILRLIGD